MCVCAQGSFITKKQQKNGIGLFVLSSYVSAPLVDRECRWLIAVWKVCACVFICVCKYTQIHCQKLWTQTRLNVVEAGPYLFLPAQTHITTSSNMLHLHIEWIKSVLTSFKCLHEDSEANAAKFVPGPCRGVRGQAGHTSR